MPILYEIDQTGSLIRTRCIGNLSLAEVLGHFKDLAADPACPERLNVLLDLNESERLPTSGELMQVAGEIGQVHERVRFGLCAIVAPQDALFGMIRMFEVFAEKWIGRTKVFRTLVEAEAWLAEEQGP